MSDRALSAGGRMIAEEMLDVIVHFGRAGIAQGRDRPSSSEGGYFLSEIISVIL
ncbi:MAG TPA: hypothetical protein VM912_07475 [Terriglobales bacterium]|nr:hypothetical protein [Terriglobales bacterium]